MLNKYLIVNYDKLKDIKRTRNRIYNIGALAYVFSWILYKLGIFSNYMHKNTIGCINQKKVFADENNIATYGVFVAEK